MTQNDPSTREGSKSKAIKVGVYEHGTNLNARAWFLTPHVYTLPLRRLRTWVPDEAQEYKDLRIDQTTPEWGKLIECLKSHKQKSVEADKKMEAKRRAQMKPTMSGQVQQLFHSHSTDERDQNDQDLFGHLPQLEIKELTANSAGKNSVSKRNTLQFLTTNIPKKLVSVVQKQLARVKESEPFSIDFGFRLIKTMQGLTAIILKVVRDAPQATTRNDLSLLPQNAQQPRTPSGESLGPVSGRDFNRRFYRIFSLDNRQTSQLISGVVIDTYLTESEENPEASNTSTEGDLENSHSSDSNIYDSEFIQSGVPEHRLLPWPLPLQTSPGGPPELDLGISFAWN